MRSVGLAFGAIASAIIILAGIVWVLTFGFSEKKILEVEIPTLNRAVSIEFGESGTVRIQAETPADIPLSIGFAHASNHTWDALLVRQMALGKVSEWFGEEAYPEDRLAKKMEFERRAPRLRPRVCFYYSRCSHNLACLL